MTYATQQDLVDRFGDTELVQFADRDADQQADAEVVARALADADADIDAYLAARYTLPLAETPPKVRALACDIARFKLMVGAGVSVQLIEDLNTAALAFLRDLAKGVAQLDLPPSGTPVATGGGPQVAGGDRVFTTDTLKDF